MPRRSLVIPVYKGQGYLTECLDSVLGQDYTDFEVIAVDDCSPDGSGAILDEYAERDARIHVIHLTENVGLGRARNAGMEKVQGDYVLFLDSDDTLTDGALRAIADRLEAAGDPEILVYDYARSYWDGRVRPNQRAELLQPDGPEAFPLAERPKLLDLLQIVWNKAYRRDFVLRHELTFPPGYYEDAPWTFCSMISAERIAVLNRVCVMYRQRREGGNILKTVSRKHFDVFDQYRRVFDYLDAHPAFAPWREALGALGAASLCGIDIENEAVLSGSLLLRELDYPANFEFHRGDMWRPVAGRRFDLIAANLPHFPMEPQEIGCRLPSWSSGGADGRALLDRFLDGLPAHLTPGGRAVMTHNGFLDLEESRSMIEQCGLSLRIAQTILVYISGEKLALMNRDILCAEEGRSIYRYGPYAFGEMHIVEIGAPEALA